MNILRPPCDEGVIAAQKTAAPCTKAQRRWILAATILGSSMSFIDGTVVNGALLVPGSLAIISASFPEEERGQAIGTWSGSTAITTALGPVIGGWLIEHVSWRAVFFLNLPLAVVVLLLVVRCVPESRNEEDSKELDFLGAALATLSLGAIVYGLIESSRLGLQSPIVIAALVAGTIIFGAFILVEARVQHPMMPLTLFSSRN